VASHRGNLDFICIESWSTKKRILQRFQRSRYSYWYNRYTTKAPHYEDAVRVYIRRIRIGYRVIAQGKLSTLSRFSRSKGIYSLCVSALPMPRLSGYAAELLLILSCTNTQNRSYVSSTALSQGTAHPIGMSSDRAIRGHQKGIIRPRPTRPDF
jgi:hypothetical protein